MIIRLRNKRADNPFSKFSKCYKENISLHQPFCNIIFNLNFINVYIYSGFCKEANFMK